MLNANSSKTRKAIPFALSALVLLTLPNMGSVVYAQDTKSSVTSEPNNSYYILFVIIPVIALAICVVYLNKRKQDSIR